MKLLAELHKELTQIKESGTLTKKKLAKDSYYLLLSMPSAIREQALYDRMMVCEKNQIGHVKEQLSMLHIEDEESLSKHLQYHFQCGNQFEQFLTFWKEEPCFDIEKLQEGAKKHFEECIAYAKELYPYVDDFGFRAWDISESIFRIRQAYTVGYLSLEKAKNWIESYQKAAVYMFRNFYDYTMSYVCGGAYYMYRESKDKDRVHHFVQHLVQCVKTVWDKENGAYRQYGFLIDSAYFKDMSELESFSKQTPLSRKGCFISNRISQDGYQVGYFYRDAEKMNDMDSGWRFFAGDESEEYLQDGKHMVYFSVDTILTRFPILLTWINESEGSAFVWENGTYHKVVLETTAS